MPNHVTTEIVFRNVPPAKQAEIISLVLNAKGEIDFDILVPTPKNMWLGNVGKRHEECFGDTALEWSRREWGTKWNAYGKHSVEPTDDTLTLVFDTAWNPPWRWLVALLNTTLLDFDQNSLSEGWDRARCWTWRYNATDQIDTFQWEEIETTDEMHRHMHQLRWGCESFEDEDEGEPLDRAKDGSNG